jgi:PKD repeat protein
MLKKALLTLCFVVAGFLIGNAQIIKSGNIVANETWTNNNIYLLSGWVYVKAGVTLTIQPGTIIKGDFVSKGTLIIERDAKIIADGTVDQPIVFTSQKAAGQRSYGDWGGLIICGRASVNLPANVANNTVAGEGIIEGGVGSYYGGGANPDDNDSSGVLRYVRIEYPGVAFQPNSEINGLTMGGVGRRTVVEHIQVSYSGDDSFEFFGGTVNAKWLIAYRGWDDDYDTDNGYRGNIQFGVTVRDPNIADQSGSNCFESDNDATGTGNTPITQPVFSNMTMIGPYVNNSTINSNYRRALHLRRNTRNSTYNSVFCGYPTGLLIESTTTQTNATNGDLQFRNCVLAQMSDTLAATTAANPNNVNGPFNITSWFASGGFNNQSIATTSALLFNNTSLNAPDLRLGAGSPLLSGASFSNPNLTNTFFTPTTYIGAFDGANNWTACWAEWDPQNQAYNAAMNNSFTATATAQGTTTFCQGGSVVIDATTSGATSYLWSNNATTASITATTSGTYSCVVTKTNGCTATSNAITVTVNALPTAPVVSANGPVTFCNGGSVVLTSDVTSGIVWSNNATTASITVNASGVYDVTVTDGNGCSSTSTGTSVVVNANPTAPTVTVNGSTTFCTGDSVELVSSQASGNTWSTTETTSSIWVDSTGNYTVTFTDANGCSATSNSIQVSVSNSPAPTVSITGALALCPGETVTLTASQSDSYLWSNGATTQTITVSQAGSYYVTVTNSDPCNGVGQSQAVTVVLNPAPTAGFTFQTQNNVVTFTNSSTGGTLYSWDFGDQTQSSGQNPQHVYVSSNSYTVTLIVTNADGCTDTITQVVQFFVGVEEVSALNSLTLYPNPANEQANLVVDLNSASEVNVVIFNMAGQVLVSEKQEMSAGTQTLNFETASWSSGIYFIHVQTGSANHTLKLVIRN